MRRMYVIVLGIGVIVVLGLGVGWFACIGWRSVATRFEDTATISAPISEIRITGKSVWVELRTGNEAGVQVHRTVLHLNPFHAKPGPTQQIDGSVLELRGDESGSFSATEYAITAPAGVRISADVGTGSLDLAGVSTVDAKLRTGSLAVADATGDIAAQVGTGQITGTGLRSDAIVATTGTGAISLELDAPGNVEATTSTGSVEVRVPPASYHVDATARMGKVQLGIPNDPTGPYRLALRAGTGQVTLAAL